MWPRLGYTKLEMRRNRPIAIPTRPTSIRLSLRRRAWQNFFYPKSPRNRRYSKLRASCKRTCRATPADYSTNFGTTAKVNWSQVFSPYPRDDDVKDSKRAKSGGLDSLRAAFVRQTVS